LSSHRKSSDESIQAAGGDQIKLGNQLVAQITTLLESFRATSVQKEQFNNLREDKIRLEEQLKSSESVVQEIRDSRTSADIRESQLRNIMDGLLNELKMLRNQSLAVHKPRPQVDERDMISTWQMKYTTISQKLTNSEEHLKRREEEIRQGEEDVKKLSEQLERARVERDVVVQALSEAEDRRSADWSEIGKLQRTVCGILLEIIVESTFALWGRTQSVISKHRASIFVFYNCESRTNINPACR
jgi:chromosome segregation ATPase